MASARLTAAASARPVLRTVEPSRPSSVCRVHSCLRCRAAVESYEPCSFVASVVTICSACRAQEQVTSHLPSPRTTWAANLASLPRGAA